MLQNYYVMSVNGTTDQNVRQPAIFCGMESGRRGRYGTQVPLELMRRAKLDEVDVNDRIFAFSCDPNIKVMPEKGRQRMVFRKNA